MCLCHTGTADHCQLVVRNCNFLRLLWHMGKGVTKALYSPDLYIISLALLIIVPFVLRIWRERDLMPADQDQSKPFLYLLL